MSLNQLVHILALPNNQTGHVTNTGMSLLLLNQVCAGQYTPSFLRLLLSSVKVLCMCVSALRLLTTTVHEMKLY